MADGDLSANINRRIETEMRGLVPHSLEGPLAQHQPETLLPSIITLHVKCSPALPPLD